ATPASAGTGIRIAAHLPGDVVDLADALARRLLVRFPAKRVGGHLRRAGPLLPVRDLELELERLAEGVRGGPVVRTHRDVGERVVVGVDALSPAVGRRVEVDRAHVEDDLLGRRIAHRPADAHRTRIEVRGPRADENDAPALWREDQRYVAVLDERRRLPVG